MNLHRLDLAGGMLAIREWNGEGAVLVWHALGQAASGVFAAVMASRLASHGLHVHAIYGPRGLGQQNAIAILKTPLNDAVSA